MITFECKDDFFKSHCNNFNDIFSNEVYNNIKLLLTNKMNHYGEIMVENQEGESMGCEDQAKRCKEASAQLLKYQNSYDILIEIEKSLEALFEDIDLCYNWRR